MRLSGRRRGNARIATPHGRRVTATVTTRYIPTVGEHAGQALVSFEALQNAIDLPSGQVSATVRAVAIEFVHSCLALMGKFPTQARREFASVLPFTHLELELMNRWPLEDAPIVDAVAARLMRWVSLDPIFAEEANAHPADFLVRLAPHLDLWSQRQEATAAAAKFAHF